MRESSRNIYRAYQARNQALFGKSDPFRQTRKEHREERKREGKEYRIIFWNGYSKGEITVQANSKEEAEKKCIFEKILEIKEV